MVFTWCICLNGALNIKQLLMMYEVALLPEAS
jgi:hypothetical protein